MQGLKRLRKNKLQNMEEPLVDRLSRPKSAVAKFARGHKKSNSGHCASMKSEVHADCDVDKPWYYGYNNSAEIHTGGPFAVAARFGFRGAAKIAKQCMESAKNLDVNHPESIHVREARKNFPFFF